MSQLLLVSRKLGDPKKEKARGEDRLEGSWFGGVLKSLIGGSNIGFVTGPPSKENSVLASTY